LVIADRESDEDPEVDAVRTGAGGNISRDLAPTARGDGAAMSRTGWFEGGKPLK
jgi:hypothetical protein